MGAIVGLKNGKGPGYRRSITEHCTEAVVSINDVAI